MKPHIPLLAIAVSVTVLGIAVSRHARAPAPPTILSFRIGQPFEEVVKGSTYPVLERSNIPTHAYLQAGDTWVTEPAVILQFNDPRHGFTLPPTKFAMVGYMDNVVDTVATSPMLGKLPFDQTLAIVENLQKQFKAGGWEPWQEDGSTWFDLTPDGKRRLYARMFESGFSQEVTLRVPEKYAMTFRLKCTDGCWSRKPPYRFLIDVGVGHDTYSEKVTSNDKITLRPPH